MKYNLNDILEDAAEYLEIKTFSDISPAVITKRVNKILSNLYPKVFELITISKVISTKTKLPFHVDLPTDIEKICRIRLYAPGTYNNGCQIEGFLPLYNWEAEQAEDEKGKGTHKQVEFFKEGWTGNLVIKAVKVLQFDENTSIEIKNIDFIIHHIASWYWRRLANKHLRSANRSEYKLYSNASIDELKLAEYVFKSSIMTMPREDTMASGVERHRNVMKVINSTRLIQPGRLS